MTAAEMLRNRLRKNLRRYKSSTKNSNCFRIYDRDIPELPLAIDRYGDWLHIIFYETPHGRMDSLGKARTQEFVDVAAEVCQVPPERCVLKTRARRVANERVKRLERRDETIVVHEREMRFRVNLHDYIDTGLFLDHGPLRKILSSTTQGMRVLNLYCYTGSLSVAAAVGGAAEVVSVDLSSTYLAWAEENLRLNADLFSSCRTSFIENDVLRFLNRERSLFDLIIVDPPIASTSAHAPDFDIQQHAARLIESALKLCAPTGSLFFSTPLRTFRMPKTIDTGSRAIHQITERTTPVAFRKQPHQSFWISTKPFVS